MNNKINFAKSYSKPTRTALVFVASTFTILSGAKTYTKISEEKRLSTIEAYTF